MHRPHGFATEFAAQQGSNVEKRYLASDGDEHNHTVKS